MDGFDICKFRFTKVYDTKSLAKTEYSKNLTENRTHNITDWNFQWNRCQNFEHNQTRWEQNPHYLKCGETHIMKCRKKYRQMPSAQIAGKRTPLTTIRNPTPLYGVRVSYSNSVKQAQKQWCRQGSDQNDFFHIGKSDFDPIK